MAAEPARVGEKEDREMKLLALELALYQVEAAGLNRPDLIRLSPQSLGRVELEAGKLCKYSNDKCTGFKFRGIPVGEDAHLADSEVMMTIGPRTFRWKTDGIENRFQEMLKTIVTDIADLLKASRPGFAQGGPVSSRTGPQAFVPGSYPGSEVILPRSKAYTHTPAVLVQQANEPPTVSFGPCPHREEE